MHTVERQKNGKSDRGLQTAFCLRLILLRESSSSSNPLIIIEVHIFRRLSSIHISCLQVHCILQTMKRCLPKLWGPSSSGILPVSGACGLPRVNPAEKEELEGEVLGFCCSLLLPAALRTRSFVKKRKERQETYSCTLSKQNTTYVHTKADDYFLKGPIHKINTTSFTKWIWYGFNKY